MRITQNSIYNVAQSRLATLVEEYSEANRVVTTGKKINRLSDDPVGISSVVNLRSNLANLDQLADNINTASTWLTGSETSQNSMKSILEDSKVLALSMRNDTMTATDRQSAAVQIEEALEQVLELANTQVNGQYLYSGTKTDTKPFEFVYSPTDPDVPIGVTYSGNDQRFNVKTGKDAVMPLGYNGDDFFDSDTITIDTSNNMIDFQEDVGAGFGTELTATIESGTYTRDELAMAIQNALNTASDAAAAPGAGINYLVSYDEATEQYTIQDDNAVVGSEARFLWETGTHAGQSIAPDIGFDTTDQESPPAVSSDQAADWSIFKTLIDFRDYLKNNDVDGIDRSMSRLDTQYNNIVDEISQIGYKGAALDLKTTVIEDLGLAYKGQKAEIEEADLIEAITTLQAKQSAYKAALASTSQIMSVSLLDYL